MLYIIVFTVASLTVRFRVYSRSLNQYCRALLGLKYSNANFVTSEFTLTLSYEYCAFTAG